MKVGDISFVLCENLYCVDSVECRLYVKGTTFSLTLAWLRENIASWVSSGDVILL